MTTAAVIGCGDISVMHLDAIAKTEGARLVAVADTDAGRAGAVAERYGVPAYADHRALLAAAHPDVVHICTPHDQHVEVAIDALAAGCHVLTEKPLAHSLADADRLVRAAAERPGQKLGVCFQNRYNGPVQAMRDLLGGLGPVLGASATVLWHRDDAYYRSRPWRGQREHAGGGVLMNQAIHTIDLLQWLLGDVTDVRGHAGRYRITGTDVEDTADVLMEHPGGVRSALFATVANAVDAPVTIEITTGRATLFLRDSLTVTYADGRVDVVTPEATTSGGRSYWGASHELLIADFYRTAGPFWIDAAEARKSLKIIQQLYAVST